MNNAGPQRETLEALFDEAQCLSDLGVPIDLVAWLRGYQRSELLNPDGAALPGLSEIIFDDAAGLRRCLDRFADDPAARRELAEEQRLNVERRLSYTAGMRRTLTRVGRLLTEEQRAASTRLTATDRSPVA